MRLIRWFGRSDRDYQEEIREHIEMETRANIERGMSPEDASVAAKRAFGGVERARQTLHEGRPTYWLSSLVEDIRYGMRMIRRNRMLSCAVVLTLTIGIGITTGVFSILNPMTFKPAVDDDPGSFVIAKRAAVTVDEYTSLREQTHALRELAAFGRNGQQWERLGPDKNEKVGSTPVSCNFFSVFPETARMGRLLEPADCFSSTSVMVLTERLWRDHFAADPAIIGKSFTYGDRRVTIVGVTLARAQMPRLIAFGAEAWVPLSVRLNVQNDTRGREFPWLALAGRLNSGYSRREATAELEGLSSRFDREGRGLLQINLTDGSAWADEPDTHWWVPLVLALPTLLMLIAAVNVATLLLGRAAARRQEMAIRLSLGAGRVRLIRMLLVENCLLAGIAALASLFLVYRVPPLVFRFLIPYSSRTPDFTPDWRVFAYLGICTILAAIASGLMPALESLNLRLADSLKGRQSSGKYRGASRIRIGIQVAFSMAPLVVVAMFIQAEFRLAEPGLETRQVALVPLPPELSDETRASLGETIAAVPGVKSVAYSRDIPLLLQNSDGINWGAETPNIPSDSVSPGYFRTVGIPIVVGREFEESDLSQNSEIKPIIVSQTFARRFFPGENPIGKTVSMWTGETKIVGMARDRSQGINPETTDAAFIYVLDETEYSQIVVRFDGTLVALSPALKSIMATVTDSKESPTLLQTYIDEELKVVHRIEALLVVLGALSVTLSVIGVFGVVSFAAIQRKKEVAIRLALGASRADILRTILRSGLRPIPIGMAAGLLLSWGGLKVAASRAMLPLAIEAHDPIPYIAVCALLMLAVLAAMLAPALRVAAAEPIHALREE